MPKPESYAWLAVKTVSGNTAEAILWNGNSSLGKCREKSQLYRAR
jgi:hypothetical protein